jgi:NAD(P)-dependent dehydrogenase (short-subunit alcohol dehydrogenase family)
MKSHDPLSQFRLDKRVILITGAAGHLGSPIAKAVAAVGAIPLMGGRNAAKLQGLSNEIGQAGGRSMVLPFDIGDGQDCRNAIDRIKDTFGNLHGIVNCAYSGRPATLEMSTEQDFVMACQQNLAGPFTLVHASIPLMRDAARDCRGGASIVNIASMYGMVSPNPSIYGDSGMNNPPFYGATKAGLIQLTRYLAVHLGPYNIRSNSLSPGPFPPLSVQHTQPEFHESLCRKTALGRIGLADELVGAVLFLLSDASSYITGANLAVDGGWTAW